MPTKTFDSIVPVTIESDMYFNECRTLQTLSVELVTIAKTLQRPEVTWQQQTGGKLAFLSYGLDIDGTKGNLDFPVSFSNGRYRVGDLSLTRKNATDVHTSSIPSWSVTEVFEQLTPRYCPNPNEERKAS